MLNETHSARLLRLLSYAICLIGYSLGRDSRILQMKDDAEHDFGRVRSGSIADFQFAVGTLAQRAWPWRNVRTMSACRATPSFANTLLS